MKTMTQFAKQQFVGYFHAKRGYGLIDLIMNMGLSKNEWEQIKSESNLDITDAEMQEVEEHFSKSVVGM